jgi:glyoxylase-like metal-dependent hydrolase (beta-lactamase superfamily II)
MEVYLFDSGTLALGGVEVPVPFFLIRHPKGDAIVDGGNPLAIARDPHAHLGGLADIFISNMTEQQHCAAQVAGLGVDPEAVSYVVQTHLHFDHTGALGHFPNASVIVHQRELEAARTAEPAEISGYIRADFDRPELEWRPWSGELDLYGDGTVRLIETPGHSAGHASVLLNLEQTGAMLLTADASDNREMWEGRAHPRALYSKDQANHSMQKLRDLAAETGAVVAFGHDPDDWAQHMHAPDAYR